MLPAVTFRVLAKIGWPFSVCRSLSLTRSELVMYISPRTSKIGGMFLPTKRSGTSSMVRTLCVMSSPDSSVTASEALHQDSIFHRSMRPPRRRFSGSTTHSIGSSGSSLSIRCA